MKTVIIALNSKYIHSSLAPWYLKNACKDYIKDIDVLEYTINDDIEWILSDIYLRKPDIAAFSCYIWNINHIIKIAKNIKKVIPTIKIIFGGPEVSYTPEEIMKENSFVDFIICGEGEESFNSLITILNNTSSGEISDIIYEQNQNQGQNQDLMGICYRRKDKILYDGIYGQLKNLDSISTPYTTEMISSLGNNKIVYYEASRGCPFSCSYCLSSTFDGVRTFSMERVKEELSTLIQTGIKQIKFVDRTFNCNKKRAKEIIKFAIDSKGEVNFHFEVAADLFDDEMIEILSMAPDGKIQLEIGVQTTNTLTLSEIKRVTCMEKVFNNIKKLKVKNKIHLHLDLIAGLPYEDYSTFKKSFNDVYALEPHQLQLGFLKLLKGSHIRNESQKHGYVSREYPPYEILYNKYISYFEISQLKGIEETFERYYNSGRFINSLKYIINNFFKSPFEFYQQFYLYNQKHGYLDKPISGRDQYTVFVEYVNYYSEKLESQKHEFKNIMNDLLKLDFLSTNNTGNLPDGINRVMESGFKDKCYGFLKDMDNLTKYLPEFKGMPFNQIIKRVRFETFNYNILTLTDNNSQKIVILFDYSNRNKVTGVYKYFIISDLKL